MAAEWIVAVMQNTDPLKEAKADQLRIETGTSSRRSIVEEPVKDFDKLLRQISAERHQTKF